MRKKTTITTTKENLVGELKKNSIAHALLYGILVGIIVCMLIFCYFSVFTSNFYLRNNKGDCLVGVASAQKFENVNNGDLLFVSAYESNASISVGDHIYFSGNSGKGSGLVVAKHIADGYLTIITGEEVYNVSLSTVLGKVAGKTQFWGYIVYFFQSTLGLVVLNILLVIIVALRMIFIATTETSIKGRELQAKLAEQKKAYARRKKTSQRYKQTKLDSDAFEILSGAHQENKKQLFEIARKEDQANAFKFLLEKVYDAYLTKPQLSVADKIKISNCIELMAVAYGFDMDVEYMINDLIIKCPVVDFDMKAFADTCVEEIVKTNSLENLSRFCSTIYLLAKLNKCVRTKELTIICEAVLEKLEDNKFAQNDAQTKEDLQKLVEYTKKYVKK